MKIYPWLQIVGVIGILASLIGGCGREEKEFDELDGDVGNVPGNFLLSLSSGYRDSVDAIGDKMNNLIPGLTGDLVGRFSGDDEKRLGSYFTQDGSERKLSDLLKLSLPGTESETINQELFKQLRTVGDGGTPYFDAVDTEKYLNGDFEVETVDDADFAKQYYMDMIRWQEAVSVEGFDDQVNDAVPVVVAVVDTGVEAAHEDLVNVMWKNSAGEVGYDAVEKKAVGESTSTDENGHGTHVAGIIGAHGSNAKGIHGVGYVPRSLATADTTGLSTTSITEIMNIRVLNAKGSGTSDVIGSGVRWAVDEFVTQKAQAGRENQKLVINMSLGGPFEVSGYDFPKDSDGKPVFKDEMFTYAASQADALIIVAAGNDSCGIGGGCDLYGRRYDEAYYFPCSYQNVLCVAASTHQDNLAGFSNRKQSVGISAPGFEIISTIPGGKYGTFSGTSQATPVVAGAASMLWSFYPNFTASQIKSILQKTAARVTDIANEVTSGDGRLDLKAALAFAASLTADSANPLDPTTTDVPDGITSNDKVPAPDGSPTKDPSGKSPNAFLGGSETIKKCATIATTAGADHAHASLVTALALMLPLFAVIFTAVVANKPTRSRRSA